MSNNEVVDKLSIYCVKWTMLGSEPVAQMLHHAYTLPDRTGGKTVIVQILCIPLKDLKMAVGMQTSPYFLANNLVKHAYSPRD